MMYLFQIHSDKYGWNYSHLFQKNRLRNPSHNFTHQEWHSK